MFANAPPTNEMVRPRKSRRNSRSARAPRRRAGAAMPFVPVGGADGWAGKARPSRGRRRKRRLGSALLPVALQPGVGLPERHRLLVRLAVRAEVGCGLRLELLLACAGANAVCPLAQARAQLREVPEDVLGDAEVDQRQSFRPPRLDLLERALPGLEVDLGRRGGREHELAGLDPHTRGVPGIERAVCPE